MEPVLRHYAAVCGGMTFRGAVRTSPFKGDAKTWLEPRSALALDVRFRIIPAVLFLVLDVRAGTPRRDAWAYGENVERLEPFDGSKADAGRETGGYTE